MHTLKFSPTTTIYCLLDNGIYTFKKSSDNCKFYNKIVRFHNT